ncbi:ketopantoate reductase family protein [Methanoplanus endosymbiosus]|uniref:2-dehydropantoate 2-reductase n=1 Tax=Methanoplanus endosymbiosus TaxID=33865 RepID=A0A9E7PNA0_9EURY|nr:ketopantoate reductase family protein [Methanoplanus endosymbiosus]UUX92432.1 ketopantoate reductase family protein [Methanoplanus endosymbiosus]
MPEKSPSVLILGAGAVGLSFAAVLSGHSEVSVVCREKHAKAIYEKGLELSGIWGEHLIREIICYTSPDMLPEKNYNYTIITAKGTDTENICNEYSKVLRDTTAVSFQNGIGNEDIIGRYSPLVIGGTVSTNFGFVSDGHVIINSQSDPVKTGIYPDIQGSSKETDKFISFIALLKKCGIEVRESDDIRAEIWSKSLLNIAVNPLAAILKAPIKKLGDDDLKETISGLINETFLVAEAEGIDLPWEDPDSYISYLKNYQLNAFGDVYPSMYYDIISGKRTEIDLLNGYISKTGHKYGIDTPYNTCITNLMHCFEKSRRILF